MKFVFSFVLVFFYVSCSGSNAGLETPPQQQIKQIQQKSEQQIQQIKQETTEDIEEIQKETKKDIEEIQKETETPPPQQIKEIKQKSEQQIKEIKQKSEQQIQQIKQETTEDIEEIQKEAETPPPQQIKQQKLPTSAPPSFAKQLEQITGVYHKKKDVTWLWYPYDSWIADLSTKIVLAYSPNFDTLMVWMRSMDASEPGRFCVLLSDFNIAGFEPDYIDYEGRSGSTLTVYEAKSLKNEWKEEHQHNSTDDYRQGLKENLYRVGDVESTTRFISLFVTDTGKLESMTVYMSSDSFPPDWWIHPGVEPFRFKSSERSEEIPSDPEAFFSEQLNKSPCRFIDKPLVKITVKKWTTIINNVSQTIKSQ